MTKRSWRCMGLSILVLCPLFLLRKQCIWQRRKCNFLSIGRRPKVGKEHDHRWRETFGGKNYYEKIAGETISEEKRQRHTKERQIQTAQDASNYPSPQPVRSSLLFNPSVETILESWGVNSELVPVKSSPIPDPTISELVASWGNRNPVSLPSPVYPSPIESPSEKPYQSPSSLLSTSSVDDILQSWFEKADEPLSTGDITGTERKKSMGGVMKGDNAYPPNRGMMKGKTDFPATISPTPSVSTSLPSSNDLGKGKGMRGMSKSTKKQTDAPSSFTYVPTTAAPSKHSKSKKSSTNRPTASPQTLSIIPSVLTPSVVQTKNPTNSSLSPVSSPPGKGGMGMASKMGTMSASSKSKGKGMKNMNNGPTMDVTLAPAPIMPSLPTPNTFPVVAPIPTDTPTPTDPPLSTPNTFPVVAPIPTDTPTPTDPPLSTPNSFPVVAPIPTDTPTPTDPPLSTPNSFPVVAPTPTDTPVPTDPPLSTPNSFPVVAPIPTDTPVPTDPPLSTPNMSPVSVPVQPAPMTAPVSAPIAPVTAPTMPTPVVPPQTAPVTSPNSPAPIASPATTPAGPTVLVPTIAPPTNAPVLAPLAPPAPVAGTPVAASPFQILYTPAPDPITADDFDAASAVTCAHVEQVIMDVIAMSPFITANDISCQTVMTGTAPTTITFETIVVFDMNSMFTLTTEDINEIIRTTAFDIPLVEDLISDLNMLPSDNPFSTTTMATYSLARSTIRTQDIDIKNEAINVTGSYAFGITAVAGILIMTFASVIRRRYYQGRKLTKAASQKKKYKYQTSSTSASNHETWIGETIYTSKNHGLMTMDESDYAHSPDPLLSVPSIIVLK